MLRNLFNRKTENLLEEQQSKVEESATEPLEPAAASEEQRGWFSRLKTGLAKTRNTIIGQISGLLRVGRTIDEELMEEIEEILIQADVGVNTTLELMDNVREVVRAKGLKDASELGEILKQEMLNVLGEDASVNVDGGQPHTILVLGINGAGKTTTIGKLAHRFRSEGKRVFVAAGDTFRAAAVDQLAIWCDRAGVELIRGGEGADPASVVFDAIEAARSRQADLLIVDTAGRLHTKKPLMDELSKIGRVMQRAIPEAPHEVLLVLDGTAGQNAIMQAKVFNEAVPITGVAVTKLDGTAKGGIVIAVKKEIGAPVRLIGIGEKLDDLRDFVGRDFVEALFEREEVGED
jgi:fused signal recognition particle receptor